MSNVKYRKTGGESLC